jgi:hypothetical protein
VQIAFLPTVPRHGPHPENNVVSVGSSPFRCVNHGNMPKVRRLVTKKRAPP